MQISLQQLNQDKDHRLTLHETVPMDSIREEVSSLLRLEAVEVTAQAAKLDPHLIEVEGEQSTVGTFQCSRCLTEFDTPLTAKWVEQFTDVEHKAQVTEEHEVHFIEGNVVDLNPYIREALLLNIPFAPVCRDDCKGLCPKCGINKNIDTCNCDTQSIDPRLAKLQELLNRDQ